MRYVFLLGALAMSWCALAAVADAPAIAAYSFKAPPGWVKHASPDYQATDPADEVSDGLWVLMVDRQIQIDKDGDERYTHIASKIINAKGVDEASRIDLRLDPASQSLTINALHVVRNGSVIDKSRSARITALPDETRLEERIYDGKSRVDILIPDVRVGDVVDYEYTLRSREQLFPGHYANRISVGWSDPLHWQRVILRYPSGRGIRYRFSGAAPAGTTEKEGEFRTVSFEWHDVPATRIDDYQPSWYQAWPVLEVSDFSDWTSVAQMIAPYYQLTPRERPQLAIEAKELKHDASTPDQEVMEALRFVQEKIRYTSIAIGRGSMVPADPETVLERRFGDCKDKSQLLVALLRKLGFEAQTALVNTQLRRSLDTLLPSAYLFNHAIVRVRVGSEIFWLDATEYPQYSRLSRLAPPPYDYALSLGETAQGLQKIPMPAPDSNQRQIEMTFDLRKGINKPARLDVATDYRGKSADDMRAWLAAKSVEQRQADYLNYYARYYPSIELADPMSVSDDTRMNIVAVTEHYRIRTPFIKGKDGRLKLVVSTDQFYRFGEPLGASIRHSPLAIAYPQQVEESMTVFLPEDWTVNDSATRVDDPAFTYRSTASYENRVLRLHYDYRALTDHVDPGALAKYSADRKRVYDDLDYQLTRGGGRGDAPLALAPAPLLAAVASLIAGVWLTRRYLWQYDPAPRVAPEGSPVGIGGWLLIPAFGLLSTPFIHLYVLAQLARLADASAWQMFPMSISESYREWASPALLLLIGGGGLLFVYAIALALLFFKRRSSVPALYVAFLWIFLAYLILFLGAEAMAGISKSITMTTVAGTFVRSFLSSSLWTAYFIRSDRVKATFVRRYGDAQSSVTDGLSG